MAMDSLTVFSLTMVLDLHGIDFSMGLKLSTELLEFFRQLLQDQDQDSFAQTALKNKRGQ